MRGCRAWTSTKRCTRRARCAACQPDPIPLDVQQRILDAAVRAPSGGNTQNWRFMLVDDPEVRAQLGPIYRRVHGACCGRRSTRTGSRPRTPTPDDPESDADAARSSARRSTSPTTSRSTRCCLFSFVQFDPTGGSIFPATWSAMLAARAEGVGSSLTSVFFFELDAVLEILGVPKEEGWLFSSCVTFGYPTGRWGVAPRRPVHEVSFRNHWGTDVGFTIDTPLWPSA